MKLVLCDGCARHVRIGERLCPFCGVARAALGAVLGVALVGCGGAAATIDTTTEPRPDEQQQTTEPRAEDDQGDERAEEDAPPPEDDDDGRGPDGVGAVAAYGAPAPDGPGTP